MAKNLFIWISLSMLLMILLDVQKLSIRKKIGFSKGQTVPGIFNTGLEIPI